MSRRGIAAAIIVAIVAATCIRLGLWQLDRLEQRRAFNAAAAAALAQPPLLLDSATVAQIRTEPERFLYRRAVAVGTFVGSAEAVLRGRAQAGRPGVHLVSPLLLESGKAVILVNRGWVPSPDATTIDPRPFRSRGIQRLEGWLQEMPADEADAEALPIEFEDTVILTYRRLGRILLSNTVGLPLPPLYLQRSPGLGVPEEPPIPEPLPTFDEGPHLGYAVQWFSFAVIAIVGFVAVLRIDRRGLRSSASGSQRAHPGEGV